MDAMGIMFSAQAWLAPLAAIAAVSVAAAMILLRDHLRLERHVRTLESELARLHALPKASAPQTPADAMDGALRARLGGLAGLATVLLKTELTGEQAILARQIKALAHEISGSDAVPAPAGSKSSAEVRNPAATSAKRVLLAEDDEVNGLFAQETLELAGATVDWARDGAEAVDRIAAAFEGRTPSYDLVLMDIRMPRLDGLEATRRIRALETEQGRASPVRIVALTATAMRQDRVAAQAAGIDDFLPKPYRADALARLLTPAPALARAS